MLVGDVMYELLVGRRLVLDVRWLVNTSREGAVRRMLRGLEVGDSIAVLRGDSGNVASIAY